MRAESPEHVIERFTAALNGGDVDDAIALYEPDATFAPQPGEEVKGREAIRAALDLFMALKPRMAGTITRVMTAGDVALVMNRWQLEGTRRSIYAGPQRRRPSTHSGRRLAHPDRRPLGWRHLRPPTTTARAR
jgi:uncharacterized protein (TIGR02246 family)